MAHETNRTRYILPKLSKGNYNTLMKLISNSLKFDISDPAKFRLHVLDHYFKYGYRSTLSAFGIAKSTLYDWRRLFIRSKKQINSLVPKSTRPLRVRKMNTSPKLVEFIKSFREEYGNVSKYKLKIFVDEYCKEVGIQTISVSLIGKIIKRRHLFFGPKVEYRRKRFKLLTPRLKRHPEEALPGYLEMDSITVYLFGKKYYFSTIIDVVTKIAWCKLVASLSALNAKQSLIEFTKIYQYQVRIIQTDNGREFLAEFNAYLGEQDIRHEFIYPKMAKVNGVVERFNRTIQEEFLERQDEISYNKPLFLQKLTNYLVWYNTVRPHQALNYMTPEKYLSTFPKCV